MIERGKGDVLVDLLLLYRSPGDASAGFQQSNQLDASPSLRCRDRLSDDAVESLESYAREQGFPTGKCRGMVVGHGRPVGPIVEIALGGDDEDLAGS